MDRVAFYACHYSDKKFDVPVKEQFRACHVKLEQNHQQYEASYYSDKRFIGSPVRRSGLLNLLRDVREGKIDFIITNKIDRLALNKGNLLAIAQRLKLAGIEAYTCIGNGKTLTQYLEADIVAAEKESAHRLATEWEKRMDAQMDLEFAERPELNIQQSAFGRAADDNKQGSPKMSKKVAIYARHSTDESIKEQIRLCTISAEQEGGQVVASYSDHTSGNTMTNRAGLQMMLQDAEAGQFDIVLADESYRLSRDPEDTASIYTRLAQANVKTCTLSGQVDLKNFDITALQGGFMRGALGKQQHKITPQQITNNPQQAVDQDLSL